MNEIKKIFQVFKAIRKRFILFLLFVIWGVSLVAGYSIFVVNPKYSSTVQMIVQADEADTPNSVNTINANVLLINTYKDLIKGDVVLDEVQRNLGKEGFTISTSELKNVLQITQSANSQMFMIGATSDSPQHAAQIVNATAQVFKEKAFDMLSVKKVTISSYGKENVNPTSPNIRNNIVISLFLAVFISGGICLLLELLGDNFKGKEAIEDELGLSLLGTVTLIEKK